MSTRPFVHLHNHTEYSLLDGAARVPDLVTRAAELQMPAVAMTDHGNLFGAYEFWKAATSHGITPVLGIEAYLTPGTHRTDRTPVRLGDGGRDDVSARGAYTHATIWARDNTGLHNLFRLSSLASLEGQFKKPRMDRELLAAYSSGLTATTGCPAGEVQTYLRFGRYAEARASAATYRDIFGAGNYYVEVMDHGLPIEARVRADLLRLAADLDLPLVATNDLHYTHPAAADHHAALLCIQSGSTLADPGRFKFDSAEFYLKTSSQMRELFRDLPQACDNTLRIADSCQNVSFTETEGAYMPRFAVPAGESETSWFVSEVQRGLARRYPAGIPDRVRHRAEYESGVIVEKRYASYFLIVADIVDWAKDNGIRVGPGRGSGAASLCAYALGITDLDPLQHGLIFERFLNPERPSMPDFDIDFDEQRRNEVIDYVATRYGQDRVAQIVTFGSLGARQAVRDATRVLGHPYAVGDRIIKAMPPAVMGKDMPLADMGNPAHPRYPESAAVRELVAGDELARQVVATARGLEGLKRQWGVHAAGVVMSSEPLLDRIPIMKREADGAIVTQFDYRSCESVGLVKMDLLGLRTLTVLDRALANIAAGGRPPPSLDADRLDDPDTYRLLAAGDTVGVFQLDGAPIRSLLRSMRPDRFEDISAVLALYRPGPMGANSHTEYADRKHHRKPVVPIHPELAAALGPILDETYGLIVYQEQVLEIAQRLAGYTLGQADLLRRAMGKKQKQVLDAEYVGFKQGMQNNGYSAAAVDAVWKVLVPFSDYAFNKAHTAAYGLLAYWTGYLKAHHPSEYMAALLSSVTDDKDRMSLYLGESRNMGITVRPPDINDSTTDFTPVGHDIRFGLAAIRNLGAAAAESITATRSQQGPFTDFADYIAKAPSTALHKQAVDALIKAGAFDSLGHPRRGLTLVAEKLIDTRAAEKRQEALGMDTLFALDAAQQAAIPATEWPRTEKLAHERQMLGCYVSDHPLRGLDDILAGRADTTAADAVTDDTLPDGRTIVMAGLISSVDTKRSRRGELWSSITFEDHTGAITCLVFPATFRTHHDLVREGMVCTLTGTLSRRDDAPTVFVDAISPIDPAARPSPPAQNPRQAAHPPPRPVTPARQPDRQPVAELQRLPIRRPAPAPPQKPAEDPVVAAPWTAARGAWVRAAIAPRPDPMTPVPRPPEQQWSPSTGVPPGGGAPGR